MRNFFTILALVITTLCAQGQSFTRADSLRGTLNKYRSCYDVLFYEIALEVKPQSKSIDGKVTFKVKNMANYDKLQIDLYENMVIDQITQNGKKLKYDRQGNATFVQFNKIQAKGLFNNFEIKYHGQPQVASRPPWDGGFVWKKDEKDRDWIGVACEGDGASLWWPCKDHLSDEPDSLHISITVPKGLIAVSNGKLTATYDQNNTSTFSYSVSNPINLYNVSISIANYTYFTSDYIDINGNKQKLKFYVLDYNYNKAKNHFTSVNTMLSCFETHYGQYPFWSDGYALIETPYWGMEHQSGIAYGNNYKLNEYGFDFIIVHESAHEWFGNSLSCNDHADMWIHESFATFAELQMLDCLGTSDSMFQNYRTNMLKRLVLKQPMVGPYGVNFTNNDLDVYFKGALMLQTVKTVFNYDFRWDQIMHDFAEKNKKSNLGTEEVVRFFNKEMGQNMTKYFNEYLRYSKLPELHYELEELPGATRITYYWQANQPDFNMPVWVLWGDQKMKLSPTANKQEMFFSGVLPEQVKVLNHNMLFLAIDDKTK